MATIKSYTDLDQSKKLAEILPLDSADMYYTPSLIKGHTGYFPHLKRKLLIDWDIEQAIPCWSLSALLGVLPDYTLQTNTDGTVFVVCESKKPMISEAYDNPVDACYTLIIKLHELNLL